jgi:phosphotransferase system enzyme I (PtsI)
MLDLGGDKLAMFQHDDEREENPCMGNRSMRLLIKRPELFRTQIRAMLRATTKSSCILFPMISGWYELEKVRALVAKCAAELKQEGYTRLDDVKYGIMVEIPGVVERFEDFVTEFQVFNIGSNDLTQYTLAADRNNRQVADYYSYYHPAVLSQIAKVCRLGATHHREVRMCGEMSGELMLLPLLVGLGVRQFSTHYHLIGRVKATLQALESESCRALAEAALRCRTPAQVRAEVMRYNTARPELAALSPRQ